MFKIIIYRKKVNEDETFKYFKIKKRARTIDRPLTLNNI